jgi:hypothetical protein
VAPGKSTPVTHCWAYWQSGSKTIVLVIVALGGPTMQEKNQTTREKSDDKIKIQQKTQKSKRNSQNSDKKHKNPKHKNQK